jgi:hypothetical protein
MEQFNKLLKTHINFSLKAIHFWFSPQTYLYEKIYTLAHCRFSVVIAATGFRQKNQTEKFYYAFNEKKTLTQHPTKLIVRFSGKYPIDSAWQNISRIASPSVKKFCTNDTLIYLNFNYNIQLTNIQKQ